MRLIPLSDRKDFMMSGVKQWLCFLLCHGLQYTCEKSGKYKNSIPPAFNLEIQSVSVFTQWSTCSKQWLE
jgi:hypothetical protein